MKRAVRLPVAIRRRADAGRSPGLRPAIGGVLATDNSVIPYAVGVDIACRMRMTVFNASPHVLDQRREMFRQVLEEQTVLARATSGIRSVSMTFWTIAVA